MNKLKKNQQEIVKHLASIISLSLEPTPISPKEKE
jgi:hypothetical protein